LIKFSKKRLIFFETAFSKNVFTFLAEITNTQVYSPERGNSLDILADFETKCKRFRLINCVI